MKATDLMLGDWVMADEVPARILTLGGKGAIITGDFDEAYHYDNMQPIPLTPEILEKNGFGFIDTPNGEYSSIWTGWWILEGLELGCCDNSKFPVFFNIADTNVKVNYVHELQHALKLCGIEKKIIL